MASRPIKPGKSSRRTARPSRTGGGRSGDNGRSANSDRSTGGGRSGDNGRNANSDRSTGGDRSTGSGRNANSDRGTGGGRGAKPVAGPLKGRAMHPAQRAARQAVPQSGPVTPMRIAKAMARAGLCSRRDAERWIEEGRVKVNGKPISSPALNVGPTDRIDVDDAPMPPAEPVRLWRYYKPKGLVTSHKDPQGRSTVFASLPKDLPRVVSVGRLDFNTEGLLLLTNDGALARHLELPSTGWLRRYRVRAHGRVSQAQLDALKDGIEVEGVRYGPIEAVLDQVQGANVWLSIGIREGKNREVRRVLTTLDLEVNRLIRISYGPFQLKDMKDDAVELVPRRVLIDQLGPRLAEQLGITSTIDDDGAAAPAGQAGYKGRGATPKAGAGAGDGGAQNAKANKRRVDQKDRVKRLVLVDGPQKSKPKRHAGGARNSGPASGRKPGSGSGRKSGPGSARTTGKDSARTISKGAGRKPGSGGGRKPRA